MYLLAHRMLSLLRPGMRIWWPTLLHLSYETGVPEALPLHFCPCPLIPVPQSSNACHFLATSSTCFLYDHFGHCPKWSLMHLLICIKHFFYGCDVSLSFFSFHIKRYGIWAFLGGGNLDYFWMVLDALLFLIAFYIPKGQVCSETPNSPALKSRMFPVNVNNQQ